MRAFRATTVLTSVLCGAMALAAAFTALEPFNDPDFFWHLKTGDWIWQQGELPARDPFNYTSPGGDLAQERFILTSYWLSQVLYHLVYDFGGMAGVAVLKFILAALFAVALLALGRVDPPVHAALVLATLLLTYRVYPFDRPQVFSFIFFAVLLGLLERERSSARPPTSWVSLLPVPLLMLLWANAHGGHLVGQLTLALFLAFEGLKYSHRALQPLRPERYRRLLIVGAAGLAVSFVNPNSWQALAFVTAPAPISIDNVEYASTVTFFREMRQPLVAIFWGALALTAARCLATAARPDITSLGLLAGTAYFGFQHMRYVPFFMVAALPTLGSLLCAGRPARWRPFLLAAASIAMTLAALRDVVPSRGCIRAATRVNDELYPTRAADFVIANDLKGNLHNTPLWGGYLIWRFGPGRKVSDDGRGLNPQATFDSIQVNLAAAAPGQDPPLWKQILRQRDVGYIILPRQALFFNDAGKLGRAVVEDAEWSVVLADPISLVFVRNTPEHLELIRNNGIPKTRLLGWAQP